MSADGDSEAGRRSSSPPGRESREDWKKGERQVDVPHPADKERSRSRSPRSKSPPFKKAKREPNRGAGAGGPRFFRDGTNTVRDEPHLQRARLFVGNIEPNKTERKDIIDLFSRHGEVLGVSVHKGYAFVQMDRERNANKAINYEDNQNFLGSRIRKWPGLISSRFAHIFVPFTLHTSFVSLFIIVFVYVSLSLFLLDVEFSQAALKAGAKCNYLSPYLFLICLVRYSHYFNTLNLIFC